MSGSDRCFASLNALTCGDPRVVGPRRPAPASLCARQPPQSAFRRHSLPRVCHAGVDLHIAARGRDDLGLSSTRIEIRQYAKRSPTSAVPPLRPSGSLFHRVRMSWIATYCRGEWREMLRAAPGSQPRGCLMSDQRGKTRWGDRPSSRDRAEGGSDRCFASPKALICGDPRGVGPRRSAPAGLYAKQPRQSAARRYSMPRVRHAGLDLHIAAGGRGDLELSSTRIGVSQCAKRPPTSTVLPLRPWGFPCRIRMSWCVPRAPGANASDDARQVSPAGVLCPRREGLSYKTRRAGLRVFRRAEFGQRLPQRAARL